MMTEKTVKKGKHFFGKMIRLPAGILGIICCVSLAIQAVRVGSKAFADSYKDTYRESLEQTAAEYYSWAFEKAEADYHVSNRTAISISGIQEQSRLEVLKVADVEYVIWDDDEYRIWVAIPGDGVFTVDMTVSEFLIDNQRHTVIARIPEPKLTDWRVESEAVIIYDFEKGTFGNGNYREGEALAREAMAQGEEMIRNEFLSNQDYFTQAKESAKRLLTEFIKNVNIEVEDLKVEIEFIN